MNQDNKIICFFVGCRIKYFYKPYSGNQCIRCGSFNDIVYNSFGKIYNGNLYERIIFRLEYKIRNLKIFKRD